MARNSASERSCFCNLNVLSLAGDTAELSCQHKRVGRDALAEELARWALAAVPRAGLVPRERELRVKHEPRVAALEQRARHRRDARRAAERELEAGTGDDDRRDKVDQPAERI